MCLNTASRRIHSTVYMETEATSHHYYSLSRGMIKLHNNSISQLPLFPQCIRSTPMNFCITIFLKCSLSSALGIHSQGLYLWALRSKSFRANLTRVKTEAKSALSNLFFLMASAFMSLLHFSSVPLSLLIYPTPFLLLFMSSASFTPAKLWHSKLHSCTFGKILYFFSKVSTSLFFFFPQGT